MYDPNPARINGKLNGTFNLKPCRNQKPEKFTVRERAKALSLAQFKCSKAIGGIFMCITKNGKDYSVTEYSDKWTVKADRGKLSVAFYVSKSICKTSDELREYVLKNDLF